MIRAGPGNRLPESSAGKREVVRVRESGVQEILGEELADADRSCVVASPQIVGRGEADAAGENLQLFRLRRQQIGGRAGRAQAEMLAETGEEEKSGAEI